jgi:hypothetical protein
LKDKANGLAAKARQGPRRRSDKLEPSETGRPGTGRIEPTQKVEKRRLTGSRRAQKDQHLPGNNIKINISKGMNIPRPRLIDLAQASNGKDELRR